MPAVGTTPKRASGASVWKFHSKPKKKKAARPRDEEEDDLVPSPRELAGERELPDRLGVRAAQVPVADVEDPHVIC